MAVRPVLFVRHTPVLDADREWLEPVQMCCAFDCPTTLLLLAAGASDIALLAPGLEELHALDVTAVVALDAPTTPHWRGIDAAAARALLAAHDVVVAV
jgi:hypothetical protein